MPLVIPGKGRTVPGDPSQYPVPPSNKPLQPFTPYGGNGLTMYHPNMEWGEQHGYDWDGQKWVKRNPNQDLERKAAEMALEQARWRMEQEKEKAERDRLEWNEQYQRDFAERLRESAVPMPAEQTPEQIRAQQLRQVALDQAQQAQRQANLNRMQQWGRDNIPGRFNPGPGPQAGPPKIGPVGPVDDSGRPTDSQMLMEILEELQAQYPYVPIERLREAAQSILEERIRSQTQDFEKQYKMPAQPYTPKQTPPMMPATGPVRSFQPGGPDRQLFKPGQAQPVQPPAQGTPYGEMIGKQGPATAQFIDTDNDGVDDRYQRGPGQPKVDPRAGWRMPPKPGDKPPAPPRPGMTY